MSNENGEPAKHHPFLLGQEPVAPVERGLQCLLARGRRARPMPQPRGQWQRDVLGAAVKEISAANPDIVKAYAS
jgi:hypothetical protein